jgi:hypothetical protein
VITISNSEIATFLRCPRKWYLTYYLGEVPAEEDVTGNRIQGVRIHTALEGFYGYQLDPLAVLGILYKLAIDAHPESEGDLVAERELSSAMVEGYVEWVAETGADASLRVVATEREVIVPLPGVDGVNLRAKLDQVVQDEQTGWLGFLDHKNVATFERREVLDLDPQFRFYSLVQRLAAPEGGAVVAGGYLNMLRRVKRTERSKPPYYHREQFRYSPETIDATWLKVLGTAKRIVEARQALDTRYAMGGDLFTINTHQRLMLPPVPIMTECKWACPFVTLCPMMDDGSDWAGAVTSSGRWNQADPYAYYSDDALGSVRAELEKM